MAAFRWPLFVWMACCLGVAFTASPAHAQLSAVFSDFWAQGLAGLPLVAEEEVGGGQVGALLVEAGREPEDGGGVALAGGGAV